MIKAVASFLITDILIVMTHLLIGTEESVLPFVTVTSPLSATILSESVWARGTGEKAWCQQPQVLILAEVDTCTTCWKHIAAGARKPKLPSRVWHPVVPLHVPLPATRVKSWLKYLTELCRLSEPS